MRTGLLATSAAMAVGAIGVSAGLLPSPGPDGGGFSFSGSGGETQAAAAGISATQTQGTPTVVPSGRATAPTSRDDNRAPVPSTTAAPATIVPKPTAPPTTAAPATSAPAPPTTTPPVPVPTVTVPALDNEAVIAEAVLALANVERAKIGCAALKTDKKLAVLASAFSADMAARAFFDHTDPDGLDPWDRAEAAKIKNLGGENIARGQATAQDVMESWMNSAGHRANILNCDFKTLGVGVHIADGGPWWTQAFGY